jgi:NAD(P)-dependent dehydrogenase (short-subunit alcohol dehydrogenase family)
VVNLNEHVAVITGAGGALGSHVTQAFLKAGARVIGISRNTAASSGDYRAIAADLTTAEGATSAIEAAKNVHGRIDSLIHLVGGYAGGVKLPEADAGAFDEMFDVNVRSAFHIVRAVLPLMQGRRYGRVVLTASRAAIEASPGSALYAASKAALVSLARSAAAEYADSGITVNAVLPGTLDTPGNRAGMPTADFSKWINPDDVAEMMVLLASHAGASINGAAIPIYGAAV